MLIATERQVMLKKRKDKGGNLGEIKNRILGGRQGMWKKQLVLLL